MHVCVCVCMCVYVCVHQRYTEVQLIVSHGCAPEGHNLVSSGGMKRSLFILGVHQRDTSR